MSKLKQDWVKIYLSEEDGRVDVLNVLFVDKYIKKFNPKHYIMPFGANKCREIGRLLSEMYKKGMLERCRVGLHRMERGFPKWVYSYSLRRIK